jgi:DNA-binding LacI/PurR family transcriptional regulator
MASNKSPMYLQVADRLRMQVLRDMKPGDQLPSQNQMARTHDVSVVTIREAAAVLVAEGLLDRRRGSGTFRTDFDSPKADNPWHSRPRTVGILLELDFAHPALSPFFPQVIQYLRAWLNQQEIRDRLYCGFVSPGGENAELNHKVLSHLKDDVTCGELDALVVIAGSFDRRLSDMIGDLIVTVGGDQSFTHRVFIDHRRLVQVAVDTLVARNRTRLGFIGWGSSEAFKRSLRTHGLIPDPRWIRCDLEPSQPGSGWEEFREIWSAGPQRPDGLIFADDTLFHDARSAVVAAGVRVPEQLAIITHANARQFDPRPLSVTRLEIDPLQHAIELGQTVALALEHPERSRQTETDFRMVTAEESDDDLVSTSSASNIYDALRASSITT